MNERANLPWSEQFRIVAKEWVDLNGAADLLEETKTLVLAQRKAELGEMPDNRAERIVKASPEWGDYVKKMVEARTAANRKKVQMEYLRIKFSEWQSDEANKRTEARL